MVPFDRLRINSKLTMSGGHPCWLLGQDPLDSRVKHENDGKEGGTGMTCLQQAGGIGGEGALPFDYAQGKL